MDTTTTDDTSQTDDTTTSTGADSTSTTDTSTTDTTALPDWARKALDKANKEAAKYRKEAADAKKAADDAKLSDEEKRKADYDAAVTKATTAEQKAQAIALQLSVERQARKLGIVDEDAAFRLLDTSAVEFDDAGTPTNVEALLKSLTEERPWLLSDGKATATGGSSSAPARSRQGGELTLKDLKGMTTAQIAALDPEVRNAAMLRT